MTVTERGDALARSVLASQPIRNKTLIRTGFISRNKIEKQEKSGIIPGTSATVMLIQSASHAYSG